MMCIFCICDVSMMYLWCFDDVSKMYLICYYDASMNLCIYASMYVCMFACFYDVSMYVRIVVSLYLCIYACLHVCMYVCTYVRTYGCMYVHVCVCTCTHRHTHTYIFDTHVSVFAAVCSIYLCNWQSLLRQRWTFKWVLYYVLCTRTRMSAEPQTSQNFGNAKYACQHMMIVMIAADDDPGRVCHQASDSGNFPSNSEIRVVNFGTFWSHDLGRLETFTVKRRFIVNFDPNSTNSNT